MYLSRLILNPKSRAVRRDLADCQAMHRTVMSGFNTVQPSQDARASLGVLFRIDALPRTTGITLLVQSKVAPDWSGLESVYLWDTGGDPENPICKYVEDYYRSLGAGAILAFRLRANPTRKIDTRTGADGHRRNGKRVELCGETAQLEWLQRKSEQAGFQVLAVQTNGSVPNVQVVSGTKLVGRRPRHSSDQVPSDADRLTFAAVLFDGVLKITDAEAFRRALGQGIGPAKAYGFGLLSIARPSR